MSAIRARVAACVAVLLALTGSAAAIGAFPGGNGLIVFVSNRGGGGYALYTMHTNGTGVHQLTAKAPDTAHPAWSADGTKIAFVRKSEIWVVDANGSNLHQIGPTSSGADWPRWSPDGSKIVFGWNDSVYVMSSSGTGLAEIRDHENGDPGKWWPAWSPGGTKIADVEGTGDRSGSISVSSTTGAGATEVTTGAEHGEIDTAPNWSPNGKQIAFERYVNCSGGACTNAVWVMSSNGGAAHQVQLNAATPVWSPNGKQILFVRKAGGASDVFVMNADGSGVKRLTANSVSDFSPDWQPA